MIAIIKQPPAIALSGNKMELVLSTTDEKYVDISITILGVTLQHRFFAVASRVTVMLSDMFDKMLPKVPYRKSSSIIEVVNNIKFDYTIAWGGIVSFYGSVIRGGCSQQLARELSANSLDMMSYRLNNHARQFLMTTRTNSRNVSMREGEIEDLFFINPGVNISFVSDKGRMIVPSVQTAGTLCSLSVSALRKHVFNTFSELPAYFSVQVNNNYIFDITIEKSVSKTKLLFRNSLGVFESLEMNDEVTNEIEIEDITISNRYDDGIGKVVSDKSRVPFTELRTYSIAYRSKHDIQFMRDAILSDDTYIVEDGKKRKVILDSVDYSSKSTQFAESIVLKFRDDTTMDYESPEMDASAPDVQHGEWILQDGSLNAYGFLYSEKTL